MCQLVQHKERQQKNRTMIGNKSAEKGAATETLATPVRKDSKVREKEPKHSFFSRSGGG